jgi:hypothetical protein
MESAAPLRVSRPRTAAIVLTVFAAASSSAQAAVPYWSVTKVLHRIDRARVHVGARTVRIDKDTALCAGRGSSIVVKGVRRWRRFLCTYTTFTRSGIDRDLEFRVRVLGKLRYRISDAHWVTGI